MRQEPFATLRKSSCQLLRCDMRDKICESCFCRSELRDSTVTGSLFNMTRNSMSIKIAWAGPRGKSAASGSLWILFLSSSSAGVSNEPEEAPGCRSKRLAFNYSPHQLFFRNLYRPIFLLSRACTERILCQRNFYQNLLVEKGCLWWNQLCNCRTSHVNSTYICAVRSSINLV